MTPGEVVGAVIALLSGGGVLAYGSYRIARRKMPAEIDSITVQGAESAVLTMQRVNEALVKRAESAEAGWAEERARSDRKDARIEALEHQLDRAQQLIDTIRAELEAVRRGDVTAS